MNSRLLEEHSFSIPPGQVIDTALSLNGIVVISANATNASIVVHQTYYKTSEIHNGSGGIFSVNNNTSALIDISTTEHHLSLKNNTDNIWVIYVQSVNINHLK